MRLVSGVSGPEGPSLNSPNTPSARPADSLEVFSMRIDVTGKGVDVTEALKTYAESKATRLQKFQNVQQIRMTLSKTKVNHHESFEAELVLDVERHEDFVSRAGSDDLYAAIDLVTDKGERQLRDWKDQVKQKH